MSRFPRQSRRPLLFNSAIGVGRSTEQQRVVGQIRNHSEKGENSSDDVDNTKQEAVGTTITFSERDPADVENEESLETRDGANKDLYKVEIPVRMPDMGEGENKILQWYKRPGDWIKRNDILCDIQTPDFTFGLVTEDECDAVMGEIFYEASEENAVDDEAVICNIYHEGNPDSDTT